MNQNNLRIPYTQQFSPEQTPISDLLYILKTSSNNELKERIAKKFFIKKTDPNKLAGNTLISLKIHGIVNSDNTLTEFGSQLVDSSENIDQVHNMIARNILCNLGGVALIETILEMQQAGLSISLKTLPNELESRGITASKNSSDLSGVFGWLKAANVIDKHYNVDDTKYHTLIGMSNNSIKGLKSLTRNQIAILRAMVALNITDWTQYNKICQYAEELFWGEVKFNWKAIIQQELKPLEYFGFIEIRKQTKKDISSPEGRGGKSADIKPKGKFFKEFSEPILNTLYQSAGLGDLRKIRSIPLSQIIDDIKQTKDSNKRGEALEILTIRICQMLDLTFDKWRETDDSLTAGGEVDAMLHSARLIYSRWQVQCKATDISLEAVAKEVGMNAVTLANVILIVGTGKVSNSALKYRDRIVSNSNLNIIILDGKHLEKILQDPVNLITILNQQAKDAMRIKPNEAMGSNTPYYTGQNIEQDVEEEAPTVRVFEPSYSTSYGDMYCGDSLEILPYLINQGIRAKLIMTSPPFALIKKKEYGNRDANEYIDWFMRFVPYFKQILEPNGSLVIDIGGAWLKGLPVKSTYQYQLLIELCRNGFYLAQEFFHYNNAKLPTPAEWVTIRRLRVKDAVNNVWWLVLDPFADADNRRVLKPYSDSMKNLLKNGYVRTLRPSGHDISDKFQRDNGGAIPSNVIEIANTESNSYYLRRCREEKIKPHPARFPQELPEFFIKFLTQENELVLDPFAGSNVTGVASEHLSRRWIGIEMNYEYVQGSKFRFEETNREE